jgi:hypothetical protein
MNGAQMEPELTPSQKKTLYILKVTNGDNVELFAAGRSVHATFRFLGTSIDGTPAMVVGRQYLIGPGGKAVQQ